MSDTDLILGCEEEKTPARRTHKLMDYFERIGIAMRRLTFIISDIKSVIRQDPAIKSSPLRYAEVFLYAGFWAILFYRITHILHYIGIPFIPRLLSQLARFITGIEIHPGAVIGPGLFIDHGMGVVIGETAVVGTNVLLFHGVTLGGISSQTGKRHPTVGDNVFIGAGARILGNIHLGDNCRIGAQSVVLKDVPPDATAVGIPAKIVGQPAVPCRCEMVGQAQKQNHC